MLCGVVLATSAQADPAPAVPLSTDARAEMLFRSGEKKFDSGDYAAACDDFFESLKLGPKLGTLLNLALCHETVGKPVSAWHEFAHAAAWAAQNNQRDRYEFALQHLRGLEPKLPRVVLQLPADRAISAIDIDGEPLPEQRWYLPLFLDPGEHHVAVSAPGKQRTSIAFRVAATPGEQVVYIPGLAEKSDAPVGGAPASPGRRDDTRRALGITGLGLGVAGVAVGATFGVLAISGEAREPAVKEHATFATIGFLAGAAFAAGGAWLLWTSSDRTGRKTVITTAPRADGGGLALTTTF